MDTKNFIAKRVALELKDSDVVNLGMGCLPLWQTMCRRRKYHFAGRAWHTRSRAGGEGRKDLKSSTRAVFPSRFYREHLSLTAPHPLP